MCGSVGYGAHAPWLVIDRERQEVCVRGKQREAVCLFVSVCVCMWQFYRQGDRMRKEYGLHVISLSSGMLLEQKVDSFIFREIHEI